MTSAEPFRETQLGLVDAVTAPVGLQQYFSWRNITVARNFRHSVVTASKEFDPARCPFNILWAFVREPSPRPSRLNLDLKPAKKIFRENVNAFLGPRRQLSLISGVSQLSQGSRLIRLPVPQKLFFFIRGAGSNTN